MKLIIKLCIVIVLILAFLCLRSLKQQNFQWNDTIAESWGDGKYGKDFYGGYFYLGNNVGGKVEVKAGVYPGRGAIFLVCLWIWFHWYSE